MNCTISECDDGIDDSPSAERGRSGKGAVLKKGPWTSSEDAILIEYVRQHGEGNWNAVQKHSGLSRCGKSCRLRWANHLRPNLKKGAFSQEEEQLIIELHAKMGNKWARMAAHLPGRTDNEIKNYWNTRIKRRQRAGLPLYPSEMYLQGSQQGDSPIIHETGDKRHREIIHTDNYDMPDILFDTFKENYSVLPYVAELPEGSVSNMLTKGMSSYQYCSFLSPLTHWKKPLQDSTTLYTGHCGSIKDELPMDDILVSPRHKMARSFALSFPDAPDPTTRHQQSFDAIQGSDTLLNDNFSASRPAQGAVKSELPSFQYPETDFSNWSASSSVPVLLDFVNAFIQSPPSSTETVDSSCVSPRNSGLLDALLQEAKTLNAKNDPYSSETIVSSAIFCGKGDSATPKISETKLGDYGETLSPLAHSATSLYNDCTPVSFKRNSFNESLPDLTSLPEGSVKSEAGEWTSEREKETTPQLDITTRPDVLLASSWLDHGYTNDPGVMTGSISNLLGDDLRNEYQQMGGGTSSSSQGRGLDSCPWYNMPAVCHMTET